jgi:hypothetical protein
VRLSFDLSKTPFAEVLWRSSAERRSGDLVVDVEDAPRRTIYFDQGRLVAASSENPRERLGTYLLDQGRLSQEQLARAEERIQSGSERRIGDALVATGVLRRNEVGRTVARLTREISLSLFPLTEGHGDLAEGEPSVPVEAMVGISLHRLLYVGIRSMRAPDLIQTGLGDLDRRVRLASAPPFRFILRKCPPGELRILEQVRQAIPIGELVTEKGKLSPARVKAVYALFASGVIEDATGDDGAAPRPVAHIESNTFLLAEVDGPAGEPEGDSLRLEVEQELTFSARLDTDSWIRVSSQEDVARALEAKRRRYLGFLDRVGKDAKLQRDVEALIGRITVFLLRLAGADAGASHLGNAATQTVPPLVRTRTDPPSEEAPRKIPVGRKPVRVGGDTGPRRHTGDSGRVLRVRREDPGPVTVHSEGSGPVPRVRRGDSGPVPRVQGGEPGPRDSGPVPAAGREASLPQDALPEGTPPAPAAKDRRQEPISQLVRNGELRMGLNDFASATQIYRRLVERAPDVAGYRLRLAVAMARWPPTAREAEREFLEAVRRDPNNPRIHYQFGIYYKTIKLRGRAIEEMRTAVSLDPGNEGAREHLRDLSPNDPLLDDQSWGD